MIIKKMLSSFIVSILDRSMTGREFNGHTMRDSGEGQFEGNAGEFAFDSWCEDNWLLREYIGDHKTHTDFLVGESQKKYHIDVKTKKRTGLADPVRGCSCHVELRLEKEDCHIYVFGNCFTDGDTLELLGWISKNEFWGVCSRHRKGDVNGDGFTEVADAGKIEARELKPMYELANILMNERRKHG